MAGPSDDHHSTSNNKKMMKETAPTFASQVEKFDFCGESIDISLRKLLAKVLLPKEAQQIDRAMEDFAKRYYECNPGLVDNPDVVYAVAFSILLLHTDAHNKNVRQKMNKDTFIMRTKIIEGGEGVAQEILDVMYDNIVMSEFTYADGHKESIARQTTATATSTSNNTSWFSKLKSSSSSSSNDSTLNTQQSALLADLGHKLEQLMPAENSFSYKRTLKPIPIMEVHFSLLKAKSLCLAGVRSRYSNNNNNSSSNDNTFTIKVTKAGILDRKYDIIQGGKKATARGWRPFGIILSGSQIIFFADISSFQHWQENEQHPSTQSTNLAPRRNNSFPAFSSLGQQESSSNLSVNATTVNSMSLLNSSLFTSSTSPIIPTSSTSTSTTSTTLAQQPNNLLRPVQIVSLSYAICICDEAYTKYPYVFRLITGDGQQFLLRAENDEEMEDWMLKINYAATLKTTGVRMRPTAASHQGGSAKNRASINIDKLKREEKAKEKVDELSDRIDEQVKLLDRELQLRRNLMVLVPYQKSTKDRIISFAETLGKRIRSKRIELQRLECYRDYLESELAWCMNTSSNTSQQQARKLSLPLPSNHIYTFTSATTNTAVTPQQQEANATTLPLGVGRKESIKKLTNLVITASSPASTNDTNSPISNVTSSASSSSSTTSSSQLNNVSSAISREDGQEDIDNASSISASNNNSVISTTSRKSSNNNNNNNNNSTVGSPQLPAFSFPKSFIESLSFMNSTNIKTASDKASEMDRIMRRRSQSNPILPRGTAIDKKLLFLEPPKSAITGRQRSGSEASSVKDDDDMSVIIVNDSEEQLLVESSNEAEDEASWAAATTPTTPATSTNLTTVSSSSS